MLDGSDSVVINRQKLGINGSQKLGWGGWGGLVGNGQ